MDIAALSLVNSQANIQNQASILVLRKAMDTASQQGQDTVNMLSTAAVPPSLPNLGNNIDISV